MSVEDLAPNTKKVKVQQSCPYLDTINRNLIDFDFRKLCSISLQNLNVYACLVCGKYFQGRGQKSHAYTHSLQENHYVFLNLETHRFYCLPDNYEFFDPSLDDIVYLLNPTYTKKDIEHLDSDRKLRAFDGSLFYAGVIGINNIKANDYCNVILLALAHIEEIRNYFLLKDDLQLFQMQKESLVVYRFGEFVRKYWNMHQFRSHVSPHEILQAVAEVSKKRFQLTVQSEPIDFLVWLLNALDTGLKELEKSKTNIIRKCFKGKLQVFSKKVPLPDISTKEKKLLLATDEYQENSKIVPFYTLPCDIPAPPLYPDERKVVQIPQESISSLLEKYDGMKICEEKTYKDIYAKRYIIKKLPKILIIVFKRFSKNYFLKEKLKTIIDFPLKGLSMVNYLDLNNEEKQKITAKYDVISNIIHVGEIKEGQYKVQILHKGSGKWFEIQDLLVKEVLPQEVMLSESYIQILELKE